MPFRLAILGVVVAWLSESALAGPVCPAVRRSILNLKAICPPTNIQRSTEFLPWTHEPFCIRSRNKWGDDFCVYTNADFRSGQGISIITDVEGGLQIADKSAVGKPELQGFPSAATGEDVPYVAREEPGKGIGLFVKPGERVKAGRTILLDYPAIVVNREVLQWLSEEDREELQWLALMQLPAATRARVRSLAKSWGSEMDEVSDIMKTNTIGQAFGEHRHVSIFPQVSVSFS